MNRPILQGFMILCAVFWTVMFLLPFFSRPETDEATPDKKKAIVQANRTESQTTALGLMVVSWAGVVVLRMGKGKGKAANETT